MKLQDLLESVESPNYHIIGKTGININKIEYDSRKVKKSNIFAAIDGTTVDGHEYISSAIENGAVCVLCEVLPENHKNYKITWIVVENSRK